MRLYIRIIILLQHCTHHSSSFSFHGDGLFLLRALQPCSLVVQCQSHSFDYLKVCGLFIFFFQEKTPSGTIIDMSREIVSFGLGGGKLIIHSQVHRLFLFVFFQLLFASSSFSSVFLSFLKERSEQRNGTERRKPQRELVR